jgi:hypothetical protein
MTADIDELVKLAKAATPGPWRRGLGNEMKMVLRTGGGLIAERCDVNDGNFIAMANPETILELIDTITTLQAKMDEVNKRASDMHDVLREITVKVEPIIHAGHDIAIDICEPDNQNVKVNLGAIRALGRAAERLKL